MTNMTKNPLGSAVACGFFLRHVKSEVDEHDDDMTNMTTT